MNHSKALTIFATAAFRRRPPQRASDNPAVARCIRAGQRAYNKEFDASQDEKQAEMKAERAFRLAIPLLSGIENIPDFIACVTYAMLTRKLRAREADHLLQAAKLAMSNFHRGSVRF